MKVGPAVSSPPALQRFFARTDLRTSKTSISRRSRPGSSAPFKGSRPDRLVFMLSTLSTSQDGLVVGAKKSARAGFLPKLPACRKPKRVISPVAANAFVTAHQGHVRG